MDISADPRQIFPPDGSSVQAARRFVGSHLADLHHPDVLWSALQLVSELATNAVLHARSAFSVDVAILADGAVRIEVADNGDAIPRQRQYGGDATTGRGVALVAELSRDWGVERIAGGGKIVWCEIVDDTGAQAVPLTETGIDGHANVVARTAAVRAADATATTASLDAPIIAAASGVLMSRAAA